MVPPQGSGPDSAPVRDPTSKSDIRAIIAAELDCPVADVDDHDDLIQMGLNSIRMMALAGGWRKRGAKITFAELAANPTVDSWYGLLGSEDLESAAAASDQTAEPVTDRAAEATPYPLATMQHAY